MSKLLGTYTAVSREFHLCEPCREILNLVWEYFGELEEGVNAEDYAEWADEVSRHGSGEEQFLAQEYLERLAPCLPPF